MPSQLEGFFLDQSRANPKRRSEGVSGTPGSNTRSTSSPTSCLAPRRRSPSWRRRSWADSRARRAGRCRHRTRDPPITRERPADGWLRGSTLEHQLAAQESTTVAGSVPKMFALAVFLAGSLARLPGRDLLLVGNPSLSGGIESLTASLESVLSNSPVLGAYWSLAISRRCSCTATAAWMSVSRLTRSTARCLAIFPCSSSRGVRPRFQPLSQDRLTAGRGFPSLGPRLANHWLTR